MLPNIGKNEHWESRHLNTLSFHHLNIEILLNNTHFRVLKLHFIPVY
jgi:hypothetical protein